MITVRKLSKDLDTTGYDYVFEKSEDLDNILPFLYPKLEGKWQILLLAPTLLYTRALLDTSLVPSYVDVLLLLDASQLEQLYLERPSLVEKVKTPWECYMDLLAQYPIPVDRRAARELYFRVGPKTTELAKALDLLSQYTYIGLREINKHFIPVQRVYTKQLVQALIRREPRKVWKYYNTLSSELGTRILFYSMRKYIRFLMQDKYDYLQNREPKDRFTESADGYSLLHLYLLFNDAEQAAQLYPILLQYMKGVTD